MDAVKLAKITPAKVQEWKKNYVADAKPDVKSQNRAKTSVNSALRSARCLFSQSNILDRLKDRMELPPSPFDGVRYEKRPVTKYASTINIESLIAAARTELAGTAPECFKVFLLGTFAGLPRKEIDLLEWSSFQWNENAIRIESTEFFEAKTNESHADVYIDTEVMEILRVIPTHSSVS